MHSVGEPKIEDKNYWQFFVTELWVMKLEQYEVQSYILLLFTEEAMSVFHLYKILILKGIKYNFR